MTRPKIHGRDHRRGGADPIPFDVLLAPSSLMGNVMQAARIVEISFGLNGAVLWLPSQEGPPVESGEFVRVGYMHADPTGIRHFEWLATRLHPVTGLDASVYRQTEPWQSRPWNGSIGVATTGNPVTLTPAPFGGNWNGYFYGMVGVSNDDGDVVHFQSAGGAINSDEQFGWDVTGVGHIGYLFHDFTTSDTGNITVSFASGSGSEKRVSIQRSIRTGAVTVGSVVAEDDLLTTNSLTPSLTDDVDPGSGVIVVTASQAPAGYQPSDVHLRPTVETWNRRPEDNLIPQLRYQGHLYPLWRDIGGLGQPGGGIDGGSP